MYNQDDKTTIFKALPKVKTAQMPFAKFSLVNDLTKEEREEERELIKEIRAKKSRDQSGDWRYKIRGASGHKQIIKEKKKLDKSQDSSRTKGADKLKIWYTNADSLPNKSVEFLQILS